MLTRYKINSDVTVRRLEFNETAVCDVSVNIGLSDVALVLF